MGEPKGSTRTLYGFPTYIAGPQNAPPSASTIIFFTDAFGLDLVNNKILADAYASATGLRVLVPDIIPGGCVPHTVIDTMDIIGKPVKLFDLIGQMGRLVAIVSAMYNFLPFMYRALPSSPSNFKIFLDYARKVKADLPIGGKLGLAGFCWGGYISINLCAHTATQDGQERLIDAAFAAHPSFLNMPIDIIDAVVKQNTPLTVAHAGNDVTLATSKIEEAEALLREKVGKGDGENGYHYQIKTYKDVPHGFAVRARPGAETEVKAADEAKEQAVEWFKRWL